MIINTLNIINVASISTISSTYPYSLCENLSKSNWYDYFDIHRQSYHQYQQRQDRLALEEQIVLELVMEQKRLLPNSGGRKMYHLIQPQLREMGIRCGRDKLFTLLRENGLLVEQKHNKTLTTNSRHRFYVYSNLISDMKIERVMQVWVTDITYIRTIEGFMYLCLLTDAYSRKIVGWDISSSLELEGCLRALKKALKPVSKRFLKKYPLIHHSDRGSQYCSKAYTQLLDSQGVKISMAAAGNCYENAMAERVNGILKMEFCLEQNFRSKTLAIKCTRDAIRKYNNIRPHLSLNMATPNSIFDPNFKELKNS